MPTRQEEAERQEKKSERQRKKREAERQEKKSERQRKKREAEIYARASKKLLKLLPEEWKGTPREKVLKRLLEAIEGNTILMREKKEREERDAYFEQKRKQREAHFEKRGMKLAGPQGEWTHYRRSKPSWRYLLVRQIVAYVEKLAGTQPEDPTSGYLLDELAASILRIIDGGDCLDRDGRERTTGIPRMTIMIDDEVVHGEKDRSLGDEYEQIMRPIREKWKKAKERARREKLKERTLREASARKREREREEIG